jgi:hypothetical protein
MNQDNFEVCIESNKNSIEKDDKETNDLAASLEDFKTSREITANGNNQVDEENTCVDQEIINKDMSKTEITSLADNEPCKREMSGSGVENLVQVLSKPEFKQTESNRELITTKICLDCAVVLKRLCTAVDS